MSEGEKIDVNNFFRMADVKKFPESVVEQIDSADTVCSECFSIYDKDRYVLQVT